MKTVLYQIEAITNLHVGNGEINYGVVDNLIQLDATTGFPVINASSLKGALREHCMLWMDENSICSIFGSDPNDPSKRKAGSFRFFDANLLSMPVRSSKTPFLMGTCPLLVNDYIAKRELFGMPLDKEKIINPLLLTLEQAKKDIPTVMQENYTGALIEDFNLKAQSIGKEVDTIAFIALTGSPSVLFSDVDFSTLCNEDHLPVIARNNLTKGHENLWYEQVLPRFSRLYFYILLPDNDEMFTQFNEAIVKGLVQIGANATVGYGYCRLTQIN